MNHLQGNFDKAVEILKPIRYKVDLLGGSRAQVSKACTEYIIPARAIVFGGVGVSIAKCRVLHIFAEVLI